jgi:hypothetical protein
MAEGDRLNDDVAAAETADGGIDGGGEGQPTSGSEAAGGDPAGFEPSGVGDPQRQGEGGGEGTRPGDWNPGEQSGGGELY